MTWRKKCLPVFKSMVVFMGSLAVTCCLILLSADRNRFHLYWWNWTFFHQSIILEAFTCWFLSENWKNLIFNHHCHKIMFLILFLYRFHVMQLYAHWHEKYVQSVHWLICVLYNDLVSLAFFFLAYSIFALLRSQSGTGQCAQLHKWQKKFTGERNSCLGVMIKVE